MVPSLIALALVGLVCGGGSGSDSSHWLYFLFSRRSEDTALFVLKQVYEDMNPELIRS